MGTMLSGIRRMSDELLERVRQGDAAAVEEIFALNRERLRRMVQFRLDRRLQGRIDPSDVLQDAFFEASQRLDGYLRQPSMPLFQWLRFLVAERLITLHRTHLGAHCRDAAREISLFSGPLPAASSAALAAQLIGNLTSPSEAAVRAERILKLQEALNAMDPLDREVLALRHFEHLSRNETAQTLGIEESAASKRYVRALQRLKRTLAQVSGNPGV